MFKDYDFHCPFCDIQISKGETISLKTKRANGDQGEIILSTTVGNYEYKHIPDVKFESGELVDFICPTCDKELNSDEFEKYALLKMKVDDTIVFDVLFSRQAGIQKTYLVTEDGIETYSGN